MRARDYRAFADALLISEAQHRAIRVIVSMQVCGVIES